MLKLVPLRLWVVLAAYLAIAGGPVSETLVSQSESRCAVNRRSTTSHHLVPSDCAFGLGRRSSHSVETRLVATVEDANPREGFVESCLP